MPARDGSGIFTNLGIYYGCLIFVSYILYFIIISIEFLFRVSLPYHVISCRSNVHDNIIIFTHQYYIAFQTSVSVFGSSLGKKIKS
jgi:hypothetical protein